jgi:hypothetical protein
MAILRNLATVNMPKSRRRPDDRTGGRAQWAYNHLSGMKSLRLMEAGRLG